MTFSILTAVYNRASVISQCLASLHEQSFTDFEHLIIDGASTDGTTEILRSLIETRTTIISEPDYGIYDALNKGLRICRGEIIGILHSDDRYADPDVLQWVAEAFKDPAIDAVYGDLNYISESGTIIRHWRAGEYTTGSLRRGWMPPHPALFIRRRVIEKFGVYDTSFRIAADYDAILRYFLTGRIRAAYIPRVLVNMQTGGASNSSFRQIILKSKEDYRAIRKNNAGGIFTLLLKNLRKTDQLFSLLKYTLSRKLFS